MAAAERVTGAAKGVGNWRRSLAEYTERRVMLILPLGFASGLPLLLTFSTLSAWFVVLPPKPRLSLAALTLSGFPDCMSATLRFAPRRHSLGWGPATCVSPRALRMRTSASSLRSAPATGAFCGSTTMPLIDAALFSRINIGGDGRRDRESLACRLAHYL